MDPHLSAKQGGCKENKNIERMLSEIMSIILNFVVPILNEGLDHA